MNPLKFLYIFPHPDDEAFGPSPLMYRHLQQGHEVHLITLTKGGASSARHDLGLSVEDYGDVRWKEMQRVKSVLGLTSLTVLDLEDGALCELDPQTLENIVQRYFNYLKPDVVVTYPVHGISGHPDHLATHAAIKHVFCEMADQDAFPSPKRLAFWTLSATENPDKATGYLWTSPDERIDCEATLSREEEAIFQQTLDCYETYHDIIQRTGVRNMGNKRHYEIFNETHDERLTDLTQNLKQNV